MPPESGAETPVEATSEGAIAGATAEFEMPPVDRLRDVLGPNQMITLAEAESLWGIELSQEERGKYQIALETAAQELVRLVDDRTYTVDTFHSHGAYLYPQLPRVALTGDSVISILKALRQRFGVEYEIKGKKVVTFGAMNPNYMEREAGDAYQRSSIKPAWVLAFTKPFGSRREDTQQAVRRNLESFNKDEKGRFQVASLQTAVNAALMEVLGPIGSSLRQDNREARRLTDCSMKRTQAWVNRRVDKREKSLIEMDPRQVRFKPNEGFFIAWEFPVEL